jgi:hypothetical protein
MVPGGPVKPSFTHWWGKSVLMRCGIPLIRAGESHDQVSSPDSNLHPPVLRIKFSGNCFAETDKSLLSGVIVAVPVHVIKGYQICICSLAFWELPKTSFTNRRILESAFYQSDLLDAHFAESFTKSQLQSPSYAPSFRMLSEWLAFDEMIHRASRNRFLEVP